MQGQDANSASQARQQIELPASIKLEEFTEVMLRAVIGALEAREEGHDFPGSVHIGFWFHPGPHRPPTEKPGGSPVPQFQVDEHE